MFDKDKYIDKASKILQPVKPADWETKAKKDFLFTAHRSSSSWDLPSYFLIYFLFNDLLWFKNLGSSEKIAWSFPIDYKWKAFLIEHRKFGVGVFIQDLEKDEEYAEEIVKKIKSAVKSIRPFYDYLAEQSVKDSKINVVNNNGQLFNRFNYLLTLYKDQHKKYLKNKDNIKTKEQKTKYGKMTSYENIGYEYYQNANWLAISVIEAFFSWSEHLFIHLAILKWWIWDGKKVADLIASEWKKKYKAAINEETKESNKFYNELLIIRQQLRNFVAHWAFWKSGNAFKFHSGTWTVPVLMDHNKQKNRFSLQWTLTFKEDEVIKLIEDFIKFLWKGDTKTAMYYTQECTLPTILTLVSDGIYEKALKSMEDMKLFSEYLMMEIDNAANMDW